METHHTHRGQHFAVILTQHDLWTVEVHVEGLPPWADSDNSYPTREEAEAAGIELGRRLIDEGR